MIWGEAAPRPQIKARTFAGPTQEIPGVHILGGGIERTFRAILKSIWGIRAEWHFHTVIGDAAQFLIAWHTEPRIDAGNRELKESAAKQLLILHELTHWQLTNQIYRMHFEVNESRPFRGGVDPLLLT